MDRRKFITRGSRWFLAGGLIGATGLLTLRSQIGNPEDCFVNPYCKRCKESGSCSLYALANTEENGKEKRQTKK